MDNNNNFWTDNQNRRGMVIDKDNGHGRTFGMDNDINHLQTGMANLRFKKDNNLHFTLRMDNDLDPIFGEKNRDCNDPHLVLIDPSPARRGNT